MPANPRQGSGVAVQPIVSGRSAQPERHIHSFYTCSIPSLQAESTARPTNLALEHGGTGGLPSAHKSFGQLESFGQRLLSGANEVPSAIDTDHVEPKLIQWDEVSARTAE